MYLQPYNNPRAGLYGQMYSSTLYLDVSRAPNPATVAEEQSRAQTSAAPGRLYKAQSLDVLSDALAQTPSDGRARIITKASSECSLSGLSSGSDSPSSLRDKVLDQQPSGSDRSSPDRSISGRRDSSRSSESSGSGRDSGGVSVTPRMPARPKTEEILNRCTTMTRKAALASKTRLQIQPSENIHSR